MVVQIPTEPTAAQLAARTAATTPNVEKAPGIPGAAAVTAQPNNGQVTASTATPQSPFSSSAMPVIAKTAAAATQNATTSLNTPAQPSPPPNGITQNSDGTYSLVHNGQTIGSYQTQTAAANAADVLSGAATPNASTDAATTTTTAPTTPAVTAPQGYTAGTPDSQGNIAFTNTQTGQSFTVPAGTSNPGAVAANMATVQAQTTTTLGNGYSTTASSSGNITISNPQGQPIATISPEVASSPASLSEAMGQVNGYNSTVSAANDASTAATAQLDAQYQEQLQQLQQEKDAAMTEEGASAGAGLGSGGGAVSAVSARYDQLESDLKSQYQSEKLAISSANTTAISNANASLQSALGTITENAKQTLIGLQQTAQTNFLNTSKTFDVSTANMPSGSTLSSLTLGANGSTGVPAVDALIQQGISAGYTPQQSLGLVQAGVATQNKNNQAQFLGLLQQASYANGWATMNSSQLASDPLFNAYVGMAQSYIPSLAGNPAAAQALVAGGSEAQQKLAIAATGSPTGSTSSVPATVLPPSATMTDTQANTPGFAGSIAAGTKYSPNGIYQAAMQYALDGKTPPMGLGTASEVQTARAAVVNTAGAIASAAGVTLPQLQAEYTANEDSLTTILPAANQTILNATNAQTNFKNLVGLAQTMNSTTMSTSVPILEKWLQTGQIELGNNPDVNNFVSYLSTSLTEYAKVVTGQNTGSGVTDTANAQLQKLLGQGLSPSTIQSFVTNVAQPAMESRVNASVDQVSEISSTIGNLLQVSGSSVTAGDTLIAPDPSGSGGANSNGNMLNSNNSGPAYSYNGKTYLQGADGLYYPM